jgi:excinuclease ABC subunit A
VGYLPLTLNYLQLEEISFIMLKSHIFSLFISGVRTETCLKQAESIALIQILDEDAAETEITFSENFACPKHGAVMEELSPRLFSFNSPYGACPHCHGLGSLRKFSADLVIPDPKAPLYAAIAPWSDKDNSYYLEILYNLGQALDFEIQTPWYKLTPQQQQIIFLILQDLEHFDISP